jgi:hypothetical protein
MSIPPIGPSEQILPPGFGPSPEQEKAVKLLKAIKEDLVGLLNPSHDKELEEKFIKDIKALENFQESSSLPSQDKQELSDILDELNQISSVTPQNVVRIIHHMEQFPGFKA